MKFYVKPVLSVVVLAFLFGYSGCKPNGEDPRPAEEVQLEKLSSTWKVGANGDVKLDGVSKKGEYADFQLILTGTPGATAFGYTTVRPTGLLTAWPSSGSWNFGTDVETQVIRDKGTAKEVSMSYTVTDTQLELTFQYAGAGEQRTSKVNGTWIFTLTK